MNTQERNTIVDEKDNPIGCKPRSEILPTDIYRVASLVVVDEDFRLLLGKRALTKKKSPGLWSPTVNGTVECDESYLDNVIRETQEEVGLEIEGIDVFPSGKIFSPSSAPRYFTNYFFYVTDANIVDQLDPDPEEIAELRWWSIADIQAAHQAEKDEFVGVFSRDTKKWQSFLTFFTHFKNNYANQN